MSDLKPHSFFLMKIPADGRKIGKKEGIKGITLNFLMSGIKAFYLGLYGTLGRFKDELFQP